MSSTQGTLNCGVVFTTHCFLGAFLRCARPSDVDIFCKLGAVRQNRHVIWRNINKTAMHRYVLHFAVSQVDACVVLD
jgi:hypothetical protein